MTKKKNKKKNSLKRKITNIEKLLLTTYLTENYLTHTSKHWEERYKDLANSIEEEKKEEDKKPKQRPLVTHTRLVGPPPKGFDDWHDFLVKMWETQCLCGVEIKALSLEEWRERYPNSKHNNRVNKFFNKVNRFFSNN